MASVYSRKPIWYVPITRSFCAEADVPKIAVITPFGLFEIFRMPFYLRNAAQNFKRFIKQVTHGLDFVFWYIDDILLASNDAQQHNVHLSQHFIRLAHHVVSINPDKCIFRQSAVDFVGHCIDARGICT